MPDTRTPSRSRSAPGEPEQSHRRTPPDDAEVRWLDDRQQAAWRAFMSGSTRLFERLDRDLRVNAGISLPEYEVLVRLSESPDRQLRMAELARSLAHSRSRVTHTVTRLERLGAVNRRACATDGRGVLAELTSQGWELLVSCAPIHVHGVRDYLVDLSSDEDVAAVGRVFDRTADRLAEDVPSEHPVLPGE